MPVLPVAERLHRNADLLGCINATLPAFSTAATELSAKRFTDEGRIIGFCAT